MKILYVIRDVVNKQFYWLYRIDEGFADIDIYEARSFESYDKAREYIASEIELGSDVFTGRFLEIKEYIYIKE